MLDTVKINHVQHISFTQSRLTDAVSVILSELLSYEHPSKARGCSFYAQERNKQKTALPKQSRKDTSETNQRLENWGASLAGLRPARDA